jgi:hypothetical protein
VLGKTSASDKHSCLEPNILVAFSQYFLASAALAFLQLFIYFPIESLGDFGLLGLALGPF